MVAFVVVGTLHYFTQKYMDKKMGHVVQPMEVEKAEENPADNAPLWYAILPVIPLSLILSFSSLWITTIKMNIVMAMFIGLFIGACCEFARWRFAQGLLSMGTIDSLIEGSKTLGFGPMAMMLVMVSIIVFSSIVMGSGNAPFFAFAALTPAVAAHTGLHPVLMLLPMHFAASIARTCSPITAVIVVSSGMGNVSSFDLVKRTFIPMCGALAVTLAMTFYYYYAGV